MAINGKISGGTKTTHTCYWMVGFSNISIQEHKVFVSPFPPQTYLNFLLIFFFMFSLTLRDAHILILHLLNTRALSRATLHYSSKSMTADLADQHSLTQPGVLACSLPAQAWMARAQACWDSLELTQGWNWVCSVQGQPSIAVQGVNLVAFVLLTACEAKKLSVSELILWASCVGDRDYQTFRVIRDLILIISDVTTYYGLNLTVAYSILSLVSTLSRSSLSQEQESHHASVLSSVLGSAHPVSVPTTTQQSLARLSSHPTQFVRQLNNCSGQQVP